MFTSIILACHIIYIDSCFVLVDNRGPYENHQSCIVRVSEMRIKAREMFKRERTPYIVVAWKCNKEDTA